MEAVRTIVAIGAVETASLSLLTTRSSWRLGQSAGLMFSERARAGFAFRFAQRGVTRALGSRTRGSWAWIGWQQAGSMLVMVR